MSAKFAKLAAASAALLVAAACGGGSGEKKNDAAPPPDPAQLKVWMMGTGSPEQTKFLDGVEAEFKAKHPKTDVVVEYVPWPNAAQKFQTALAGGKGPDVTEVGNTDVQTWIDQDAFADITENMNGWAEGKSLNKTAVGNDQRDGKAYGMPWYGGVRGVWYRTDWFEDLGIQTPKTWADLTAAAKKIQDEKNVPGIAAPSDFTNGIATLIWGNGGEIAVQEGGKWVGKLDQPAAKEAIGFYTGLVTKDKVAPAKYAGKNELQGPQTDFALGKVGMYMDGSWSLPQMEKVSKKNKDKWGVFPIPAKAGGNAPVFAGGSDLAVWKDSKAPDAAFDYLTVLNSKKNGGAWADISKFNSQFTDVKFSDPKLAVFTEIAGNAKFLPLTSGWAEVEGNKKVIPTAVKAIMQGKSLDDEVAKANKDLNELLNQS